MAPACVHLARRAACAVLAGTLLAPSLAAADTAWKVRFWGPKRASLQPYEWYAKEVAAKTGGRMKLEIAYGKGDASESLALLKAGAVDAAYICTQYVADKLPLLTVVDLPMFSPEDVVALGRMEIALSDQPAIDAELRQWNARMLVPTPLKQYQLMGTRRVARLDDFRGAKIRMSGEMGRILAAYGAEVVNFPAPESAAAIRSGRVELVALPYPSTLAAYKVHEVSRYVTEKISLGAALCFLGVNARSWDALPADVRRTMLELREPMVARYAEAYGAEDAPDIAAFRSKGLEFVTFNPVDRARLVARAIKVWDAWIDEREKRGLKGREVFEFAQRKIREYTQ
jgi:TRAP-type C4-dicarboxylate transport system substrate-binding protein